MKTYKVSKSVTTTATKEMRYGVIKLDDNTGIELGDKFNIKELKSVVKSGGYLPDGCARFSVSEMVVTAIKLSDGDIEFCPAIISEGFYRNSSGMLLEGMELTRL